MPPNDYDNKRITSATFLLEVDGVQIGTFFEVSGLELTVGIEEVNEGGENEYVHKLPGRMSWPNIVLKQGVTRSNGLMQWIQESSGDGYAGKGNKLERKHGAITLLSASGERLRSWEFYDAFAVKWIGPNFASGDAEMAVEELEIAHHGFRIAELG